MNRLALLGKLAAGARCVGLGRLLNLVRDRADDLWLRCGRLPLRITVDEFILTGCYRHRSFLAGVQGNYEGFLRQLFEESLGPGMVVVDGGAHIGLYTVIASRKLGDRGRVLAFEPDPHNFRALLSNLDANHCLNVFASPRALSSSEGKALFYQSAGTISSSLVKRQELFDAGCVKRIEIETTTVDRELAALDFSALLIKLDIEGAEPLAVQGMRASIKRASSVVVFAEVNPLALRAAGFTPEDLVFALEGCGLEVYFIDEKAAALVPVARLSGSRKGNLLGRKGGGQGSFVSRRLWAAASSVSVQ